MNWQRLWLGFLLPTTVSGRALGPAEEAAVDYLLQYGYLQKPLEGPQVFRPEDIAEALRAFQEASELPVSGQLDDAVRARMRQPRCGLEDPFNQKTLKYLLLGRWRKKHLTFRILNLPSTLPSHIAREALLQAFRYWSEVAPLTFQEVQAGRADIRLSFHGRQSLYCSNAFDGPGKKIPETTDEEEEETELPTEPGPMPNPCSGELDAVMLGEAFSLQAVGRQWGQPADPLACPDRNDMGLQHEQWRAPWEDLCLPGGLRVDRDRRRAGPLVPSVCSLGGAPGKPGCCCLLSSNTEDPLLQ
uniref:Peptidase metallopeptidase domain-containing protein n=1 Tax=Oryctolagus cuniculus TaxID=9986 RepID=G1SN82_RABIT